MCGGTEQFSERELILLVNNAWHAADAVPSAHSRALQIPLVCRQVGKESEVILNNIFTCHLAFKNIMALF